MTVKREPLILAIDIGGTQFSLALAERDGRIVRRKAGATNRAEGARWMVEHILDAAGQLVEEAGTAVGACGIGFGGPVDFAAQRILSSTHVAGWEGVALPALIEDSLGVPAVVENDANVGGLGEYAFGAGRGARSLVYYTISTGIGGGVIVDGAIYRGGDGNAGELGHCPVVLDGPLCDCGNRGCLEALCSGKSIARRAHEACAAHPRRARMLRRMAADGEITARIVFAAARAGDGLARELVDETCTYLGMSMASAMNVLAPEVIVVGGGVSKAGRGLLVPLVAQAQRFLMPVHRPHLHIRLARFPGRSVIMGAIALGRGLL